MVRLTDRSDMTIAVYHGRKATTTTLYFNKIHTIMDRICFPRAGYTVHDTKQKVTRNVILCEMA